MPMQVHAFSLNRDFSEVFGFNSHGLDSAMKEGATLIDLIEKRKCRVFTCYCLLHVFAREVYFSSRFGRNRSLPHRRTCVVTFSPLFFVCFFVSFRHFTRTCIFTFYDPSVWRDLVLFKEYVLVLSTPDVTITYVVRNELKRELILGMIVGTSRQVWNHVIRCGLLFASSPAKRGALG